MAGRGLNDHECGDRLQEKWPGIGGRRNALIPASAIFYSQGGNQQQARRRIVNGLLPVG